ncbi:hypothetical protein RGR602_PC00547 (plasmid) [Rhizobium gallicum bv. gallicum R602sp]|uniref:Uncharacterized protein n=1 Tax=Rhizobium gallicum bv. gallicum R602sp TaxID=1041138 RepID=A0A0B4XDJ8_9HYPH|nr:hypothetical protein RGR602_PC00547 [Rhizobium gallicum bv. gallicum R602sp]
MQVYESNWLALILPAAIMAAQRNSSGRFAMIRSNKLAQALGRPGGIKHAQLLRGQIAPAPSIAAACPKLPCKNGYKADGYA